MGAVSFSLDHRLLCRLKEELPLQVLVETGAFKGDTVAAALPFVDRVVTIERSEPLWRAVAARFAGDPKVEVVQGDSPSSLARIAPSLEGCSVMYWLDAHWCVADATSGEQSQCPLLEELAAIGRLRDDCLILIDDARLFLAPPAAPHDIAQWPAFDEIVRALRALSRDHEVMVVNDVIAFFPPSAKDAMVGYARDHGVDWLRAYQSLEDNEALHKELEQRAAVIEELNAASQALTAGVAARDKEIEELLRSRGPEMLIHEHDARQALLHELDAKQAVIEEMQRALTAYRAMFGPFGFIIRPAARLFGFLTRPIRLFVPRLGVLSQHPPIELRRPPVYASTASTTRPRISIITPSFRQAAYIERTIRSVVEQGYPSLEYFVQDGGSEDGTREILERYSDRLAGWESRPDGGQSDAINRAFARTSGEIMAWLNSDDVLFPGALDCVADFFEGHPEVDVVYGHRVLIDEDDREIGRWVMPPHDDRILSWADYVPQETLFWRRRIWERAGGRVDESFRFAMDWDLLVRFRDAGARFARIPRFLGGFRIHSRQKTSAGISSVGFQEMDRIRERALGHVPDRTELRRAVAPYLLRHVAADLAWRVRFRMGIA